MTKSTIQSVKLLPVYFQTDKNSKFLSSTIDQLIQPAQLERVNAFIGYKPPTVTVTTSSVTSATVTTYTAIDPATLEKTGIYYSTTQIGPRREGTKITIDLSVADDSFSGPYDLGFTWNMFGQLFTQVYFSTNGVLTFGSGSAVYSPVKFAILPQPTIYSMYTDLWEGFGGDPGGTTPLDSGEIPGHFVKQGTIGAFKFFRMRFQGTHYITRNQLPTVPAYDYETTLYSDGTNQYVENIYQTIPRNIRGLGEQDLGVIVGIATSSTSNSTGITTGTGIQLSQDLINDNSSHVFYSTQNGGNWHYAGPGSFDVTRSTATTVISSTTYITSSSVVFTTITTTTTYVDFSKLPTWDPADSYIQETSGLRQAYQLEPALVTYDIADTVQSVITIDDLSNEIKIKGGYTDNFDRLFRNTVYPFYPQIDLDKFNNYQNYYWLQSGSFLIDITQDNLDVAATIIGKPSATVLVNGKTINLLNGMLITFSGSGIDFKYQNLEFFVEGTGTSIVLVSVNDLITPENISSYEIDFYDSQGYDFLGFDSTDARVPIIPEYVTINRSSIDGNPWSRYNRWVSLEVITISSQLNNLEIITPISNRASRPIIEFNANTKLYNFGSFAIPPVDVIDFTTTDAFNSINGIEGTVISDSTASSTSVIIDGINLSYGNRIIFAADNNPLIRNKIFYVLFAYPGGSTTPVVALVPDDVNLPTAGASVLVKKGKLNGGTSWWFDGLNWNYSQQHTRINEGPLFDLFDSNGISYADQTHYFSNFTGNKIFGYSINNASTNTDTVLGLTLNYLNNNAKASILFENYFSNSVINLIGNGEVVTKISTGQTYIKIGNKLANIWQPPISPEITLNSSTGYYDTPLSLTNNPLNDPIDTLVSGDVRDQKNKTGTRLIATANPISFAIMFIGKKEHSVIDAITKCSEQYDYFKSSLINNLSKVTIAEGVAEALDKILTNINTNKTVKSPFYLSDMLGHGKNKQVIQYTVSNPQISIYGLPIEFSLSKPSVSSILIYLNGAQLTFENDYTFDITDPYVNILKSLNIGDQIVINYYQDTAKNYIPPTPTKLGLYPKFLPKIYVDDTYITPTNVIQGHDGSLMVAFNDYRDLIILEYELRIYNNLKVTYSQNLFDIHSVDPGYWRDLKNVSDYTFSEIVSILEKDFIKWVINYGVDYTTNNTFNLKNPFTWNYPEKGSWRAIFKYYYDTDRPHTHPWEMLGLDHKPNWWDSQYGTLPYTSGNSLLWSDLETGTIADPAGTTINSFYARPGLLTRIPVDNLGKLLDPVTIGLVTNPTPNYGNYSWAIGEHGPAETAWRRSSNWPFTVQRLLALTKPSSYSSLMYDPANMTMNMLNQWEYVSNTSQSFLQLRNVPIHGEHGVSVNSGYSVFVSEIGQQRDKDYIAKLRNDLNYVNFNLFYKVGGFLNKNTIQFFIDAYEPTTNSTGVLLPDSDYSLILNTGNPIYSVGISGMIIQRVGSNFVIRGYDKDEPYFNCNPAVRNSSTPTITIGGLSSEYVNWTSGNSGSVSSLSSLDLTTAVSAPSKIFYQKDQIVQYSGSYYRTLASHQAETVFNLSLFSKLSGLPVIGGVTVQIALEFESSVIKIPYGTTLTSAQAVYDLIIGYGNWLTNQGFSFSQFNSELGQVVDWNLSAKEFLYWTTQNWVNNSVITLSPFADQLVFQIENASVNNIFDNFYDYTLTKSDGTPFDKKNLFITRQNGVFNVNTINTDDGIYFARLNAVQKEHGVIFKNKTIFGDIVYDAQTGEKQSRIKIVGFRTAGWNGDFFSPGFVYDSATITDWQPNTPYLASSIVRYNNFYYSAKRNIDRSSTFIFSNWIKLDKKPNAGLLPNFDYKINQFTDFYSLDIDNFDSGQQHSAQNLIGYYPRVYLNNFIPDPVSQYKFYQGYIREKGTANAIAKLSKAQTPNLDTDIEIYENWAIRVGQYGGFTSSQEFEIPLIEGTFVENPQIITFVPPLVTTNYSPAHYISPFDFTISPLAGTIPKIGTTTSTNVFKLIHAGYVRLDDVDATAYNQASLLDIANSGNLLEGTTIWLGFKPNGDWDVLRYNLLGADIVDAEFDTIYSNVTITTVNAHNLSVGQIVSIVNINSLLDGVYSVQSIISPTKFVIANNTAYSASANFNFPGFLFAFESLRFLNFDSIPSDDILYQYNNGSYIWVDRNNGTSNDGWAVYKKVQNYSNTALVGRHSQFAEGHGYSISLRKGSDILLVGAPMYTDSTNGNSGALFVYKNSTLEELAFYTMPNTSGNNNKLGATVVYDDNRFQNTSDSFGLIFAGAPGAYSNSGTVQIISVDQTYQTIVQGTLINPNQSSSGLFGSSIFVQRNSNTKTVLVGAPGVNSVYSYIITATNSVIQISEATTVSSSVSLVSNAQWGYAIAGSDNGNYIAISAPFNGDTNSGTVTVIYNNSSTQTILSPFGNNSNFGQAMTMSPDGSYLAISAPNAVNKNLSFGAVAIYNNTGTGVNAIYTLTQILTNLIPNGKMYFGMALDINTTSNALVITAMGTNTTVLTIFDTLTTFDFDSTRFFESEDYSGTAYLYTRKNSNFKFSQEVNELTESVSSLTNYGTSVAIDDNSIIVGAPSTVNQSTGTVYKFSKIDNTINGWQTIRIQEDLLVPTALKQIRLIDTTSDEIVSYYDFVDPLKGKILGIADEEITYKTASDPAIYTLGGIGVNVDSNTSWIDQQLGQLWWDLSTAKFVWYEQGGFEYRKNNWGKLFPGASIDVYEWVGSELLPSEWSALADTIAGLARGISGQPKYVDNSTISIKQIYDNVTQSFSNFYFYWVKNKVTIPAVRSRKLSSFSVASYIANPTSAGIQYAAFISTSSLILANSSGKLRGNEISLNFTIDNTDNKTVKHVEWQLASEGSTYNNIPALLEKKLFDSLIGNDSLGNLVPDPTLSDRAKFGIGIRPQQTLFKDRLSALHNILDFANSVLIKNQITGNKNFSNLNAQELPPQSTTSSWVVIEDVNALTQVNTSQVTTATVISDSYYNGGWAVYQFNGVTWDRIRTQSYNTTLYWDYVDWVSPNYDTYKNISYVVDNILQLGNTSIEQNQYIKIKNRGDGNYIIITLASPGVSGTFNQKFDVVYAQNGTIQLKDTLWNLSFGWDSNQSYNQPLFDQTPNIEISYILNALKNDLFINDLFVNWNLLIFKAIKYALSEQKFIDWAFKTSLIDVVNYAGVLTQPAVYKLQDSTTHENYVNEVKPYHTKIKRFTANFENIDNSNTNVTDYDYPFGYDSVTNKFVPASIPLTNFTFPSKYNPLTGQMNIASYTSATILTTVPWRQTSTKILFDRINSQNQIGNLTVIDNFLGKAGDTIFQLSWLAQADKSKISVTVDNISMFISNYTLIYDKQNYLSYDKKYSYLKFLSPIIPLTASSTTASNTQTFNVSITYQKSVELMSASERIQNFYMPTTDMPGNNLNQLISGSYDPRKVIGGRYEGFGFANINSGIDSDTLINPSDSNYPSWNGGGLINALGINPSDINIDGSFGFISTASNQAPEELVPGDAADSIAIDVYTKSSYQTPTIFNGNSNIIKSSSITTIPLSVMPPTIASMSVTLNGVLLTYVSGKAPTGSVPINVAWATTQTGLVTNYGGWKIAQSGRSIRFQIEQSLNCGGYNGNTQFGSAIATITTGDFPYDFTPILSGLGEAQASNYELMKLYLNGVQIISAHAAGGNLGCHAGIPVVVTANVPGPHRLEANSTYTFRLDFTTNDPLYNGDDMYYLCELNFTYASAGKYTFTSSNQFTIDWVDKKLVIPRQNIGGTLGYSIIGVGDADLYGLGIIDTQSSPVVVSTTTGTTRVISMVNHFEVNGTYVTVDGAPIDTTVYPNDLGQPVFYALTTASSRDTRAAIDIYNLSTGSHLIQSWFFNSSNPKFNKIIEQSYYANSTPSFINNVSGFATGINLNSTPLISSKLIVELIPDVGNPIRLRPPFNTRYVVTTTNLTASYPIISSTSSFVVDTVRATNIQVYLNGVSLTYAADGTQDYTISNNSVLLTYRQSLFNNPVTVGSEVIIETFYYNNISNAPSIIDGSVTYDYDFMIPAGSATLLLTSNYSYLTSATIKIITFTIEDSLGLVTQQFVGNPARTYKLSSPVLNSNYLWIEADTTTTGLISLINNVDYQMLDDHLTVLFSDAYVLTNKDTVFIMSFADPGKSAKTLGYRITKDFLGKSLFTRLANDDSTYLTQPLSISDTSIFIANGSVLSPSNIDTNSPGVVLIAGERIEFFKNVDNVLSQLRRGTGGTSPARYLEVGTTVIDQGINQIINASIATPYSDTVLIQNTYTSANLENTYTISTSTIYNWVNSKTSSTIRCDGISLMTSVSTLPNDARTGVATYQGRTYSISTASIAAKDQLEVYYGGRLLKKDQSFYHDTTILYDGILPSQIKGIVPSALSLSSATIYLGDAYICQDTNEVWVCTINQYNITTVPTYVYSGLKRLLPDFTVTTSTQQIILNTATVNIQTGTQLTVIKRQVATSWNDVQSINSSTALLNSTSTVAKFLLSGLAVLPSQYFYGSSSTIVKPTGGLI